jgi:hypothetical protein
VICKWARFGYKVLPLPGWRTFLLERHLDRCSRCQTRLLDNETIRNMGTTATGLQGEPPLWPVPAARPKARTLRLRWRYAFGLSLVAVLVWVAIEGLHFVPSPALAVPKGLIQEVEESDESRVFAVLAAKIGAEPARSVIFKPQQPGMTIVWFEKI